MASLVGTIADALVSALQANQATIVPLITASESSLTALIENALNGVTLKGPFLPIVWAAIKPSLVSELVAIENAYPGTVIFAFLVKEAQDLAKQLGG